MISTEIRSSPIPAIPPYHVRTPHIRGAWTTSDTNQWEDIYLDSVITSRGDRRGSSKKPKARGGGGLGQNWGTHALGLKEEEEQGKIGENTFREP